MESLKIEVKVEVLKILKNIKEFIGALFQVWFFIF